MFCVITFVVFMTSVSPICAFCSQKTVSRLLAPGPAEQNLCRQRVGQVVVSHQRVAPGPVTHRVRQADAGRGPQAAQAPGGQRGVHRGRPRRHGGRWSARAVPAVQPGGGPPH